MKIRIKFSKTGVMKFIGHLDMMRYFQKAIRRAEIDVTYTGGYSPHQVMSFAAPLGVGLESQGEYFDIEVNSMLNCEDLKQKLNSAMSDGIEILSVKILPDDAGNAMASVAAAKYKICFRKGYEPAGNWQQTLQAFLEQDCIMVEKETKKSKKEFNLKPYLFSWEIIDNSVILTVDASSSGNIKPSLVFHAYSVSQELTLSEFALQVTRLETYTSKMEDGKQIFIPLDEIGFTA